MQSRLGTNVPDFIRAEVVCATKRLKDYIAANGDHFELELLIF